MWNAITTKFNKANQYLIGTGLIVLISVVCFLTVDIIGYRVVAFILLLALSLLAMLFDIFPVLFAALLSALIWNYFFIPPILNFNIRTPEDGLMFLMYFVIALINAVLTFKIREFKRKARDEKEKAKTIQLYNTLLNSLSHELRTPISTIIGAIDTIKDNEARLSEHNKRELYSEIEIASFRLNRQVENLLSMSRLEAGALQPKLDWCDLNELIYTVIQNNKGDTKGRQLVFEANENLPLFKTDSGLIEAVLHNIIHNALQHTPEHTVITIDIRHVGGCCSITIADNGRGFPESEIDFVFDKFYRLSQTSTGGTGLGLSIAKGFVEALNGTIHLQNLKQGCQFRIEIPAETLSIKNLENEQG